MTNIVSYEDMLLKSTRKDLQKGKDVLVQAIQHRHSSVPRLHLNSTQKHTKQIVIHANNNGINQDSEDSDYEVDDTEIKMRAYALHEDSRTVSQGRNNNKDIMKKIHQNRSNFNVNYLDSQLGSMRSTVHNQTYKLSETEKLTT